MKSWRELKKAARGFMQKYNAKGQEIPDPTRNEVALGFRRPKDIHEMIQEALRGERMLQSAQLAGMETFEEANDFDVDEEPDPLSVYELKDMHEEAYDDARRTIAASKEKRHGEKVGAGRQRSGVGAERAGAGDSGDRAEDRSGQRAIHSGDEANQRGARNGSGEGQDRVEE